MKYAQLLICFYSVIFFSCSSNEKSNYENDNGLVLSDSAILNDIILSVKVKDIAEHNSFDDSTIGYISSSSRQFMRYKWLLYNASTDQLVELSSYKNTVVRAYAIRALKVRNYSNLKQIFQQQYKDSSVFTHLSGCIGLPVSYNTFFFDLVKEQLSEEERIKFSKWLQKKRFKLFKL